MLGEYPNLNNACSGRFNDWLEVCLTPKCNGSCVWCVDRRGWHPGKTVGWDVIVAIANATGKKNIILLGGEPTLYPDIKLIIDGLFYANKNVYITTNGSKLTRRWVGENLSNIHTVNISLHSISLIENKMITGIDLDYDYLSESISWLIDNGKNVRLNCNCIKGYVDSKIKMTQYICFAKKLNVSSVRFAELKYDEEDFIDLADVWDTQYGLNKDPFRLGCSIDTVIDGMQVNFRQMCGFQTKLRPRPDNPVFDKGKKVLYYDGVLYDGWQMEEQMNVIELVLQKVKDGALTPEEGRILIESQYNEKPEKVITKTVHVSDGGYCQY
jgi:organic radical activating enzyme